MSQAIIANQYSLRFHGFMLGTMIIFRETEEWSFEVENPGYTYAKKASRAETMSHIIQLRTD